MRLKGTRLSNIATPCQSPTTTDPKTPKVAANIGKQAKPLSLRNPLNCNIERLQWMEAWKN